MQTCSLCNAQSPDTATHCVSCGADLREHATTVVALRRFQENPRVRAVRIAVAGDRLHLEIDNPPPRAAAGEPPQGESAAMRNVRQRLAGHYGRDAHLEVDDRGERFTVRVDLPAFGGRE